MMSEAKPPASQQASLINRYALYALTGPKQAIIATFVPALLAILLPVLNLLGIVIGGLVTLRQGAQRGLLVMALASLPSLVFGLWVGQLVIINNSVFGYMLVWLLAVALRAGYLWRQIFELGALLGSVAVIILHLWIPDISQFWVDYLLENLQQSMVTFSDIEAVKRRITLMAPFITGNLLAGGFLLVYFYLVLARWLQARLFNPGGLREELHYIRMGWALTVIMLLVIAFSLAGMPFFYDFLPLVMLPFFLAGISLVHFYVHRYQRPWVWLLVFYTVLILTLPYMFLLLVILAIVDVFFDLRKRRGG